jgi:tetratricopeptide (TPR) repeat protein
MANRSCRASRHSDLSSYGDIEKPGLRDIFLIDGITSILNILLIFVAAWLLFGDVETALWSAVLLAFFPINIRLSFGDSVYAFGGTLILLAFIHFLIFFKTSSATALFPALGFTYCLLYTHVVFLPFPAVAPFLYPLCGRRWRDIGALLTKTNICLVALFLAGALPAYYISPIPYVRIVGESHMLDAPGAYLQTVFRFISHQTNSFFNPDFNPLGYMAMAVFGLGFMSLRAPGTLATLGVTILLLSFPLPPGAVWGESGYNYHVNIGMVKQEHVMFLYLLIAAYGTRYGTDLLGKKFAGRWIAVVVFFLLALQPFSYFKFIIREYNYQREISFLKRTLPRNDLGRVIFTHAPERIGDIRPGRYEIHTVSHSVSAHKNSQAPTLHEPTLQFLDWLLAQEYAPVFYLSFNCYYRHFGDTYQGKDPALRDDCAQFLRRYGLHPITEETFASDVYHVESDNTDATAVKLGFYWIYPKTCKMKESSSCLLGSKPLSTGGDFQVYKRSRADINESNASVDKGIALFRVGRRHEAEVVFRVALMNNPKSIDAWMSLGALLATSGRSAQAIVCYDRILSFELNDSDLLADTLAARANAFMAMGRTALARKDRRQALRVASASWLWRKQVQAALDR